MTKINRNILEAPASLLLYLEGDISAPFIDHVSSLQECSSDTFQLPSDPSFLFVGDGTQCSVGGCIIADMPACPNGA